MASLKDVALLSGVSTATVSRAINNPDVVDRDTLQTIRTAMKKLNYRPNLLASGLRSTSSKQIALIVPDAVHYTSASMIQHTSRLLQELGYALILGNHHNQFEIETELLENYFSRNIDGIILYMVYDETQAVQSLLEHQERQVPIVIVGRRISVDNFSNVAIDNYKAGVMAGEYLGSIGHRNVATVTGPRITQWARDRLDGFRKGLEKYGAVIEWEYSQEADSDFDTGLNAARAFYARFSSTTFPTAIWSQNDIMASAIIKQFGRYGIRVPEDISLLGMDDIELATMVTPALSTIHQPFNEIAQEAIRILMEDTAEKDLSIPRRVILEPTLIVRDSTAPIKAADSGE